MFKGRAIDKRNFAVGLALIIIGVWFYWALSSLDMEKDAGNRQVIIKEGTVKTDDELARELAGVLGFDVEGAFKSGYTTRDIIDFLINQPHGLSISSHEGRYYVGRVTVPYSIPFSVCMIFIFVGSVIIIFKGVVKKPRITDIK